MEKLIETKFFQWNYLAHFVSELLHFLNICFENVNASSNKYEVKKLLKSHSSFLWIVHHCHCNLLIYFIYFHFIYTVHLLLVASLMCKEPLIKELLNEIVKSVIILYPFQYYAFFYKSFVPKNNFLFAFL